MKSHRWNRWFVGVLAMVTCCANAAIADESDSWANLKLWYRQPAAEWTQALPVGNGRLGAMVFGGVSQDRLQLNEVSLWSGSPQDADNPEALPAMQEIRRLIFDGQYAQANALASRKLICKGPGSGSGGGAKVALRQLSDSWRPVPGLPRPRWGNGLPTPTRSRHGNRHRPIPSGRRRLHKRGLLQRSRSGPGVRLTCDKPGRISFTADLKRPERFTASADGTDGLIMAGQMNDGKNGTSGIQYVARLRAACRRRQDKRRRQQPSHRRGERRHATPRRRNRLQAPAARVSRKRSTDHNRRTAHGCDEEILSGSARQARGRSSEVLPARRSQPGLGRRRGRQNADG